MIMMRAVAVLALLCSSAGVARSDEGGVAVLVLLASSLALATMLA